MERRILSYTDNQMDRYTKGKDPYQCEIDSPFRMILIFLSLSNNAILSNICGFISLLCLLMWKDINYSNLILNLIFCNI